MLGMTLSGLFALAFVIWFKWQVAKGVARNAKWLFNDLEDGMAKVLRQPPPRR